MVLGQIGFRVHLLEGGYREYRRAVIAGLETLPQRLAYRVVCGTTGSGKSRLLPTWPPRGNRCSTWSCWPTTAARCSGWCRAARSRGRSSSSRGVWDALRRFDPARPVIVESESKKVGDLRVPERLIECMRAAPCVQLDLPTEARVQLLIEDYDFFVRDTEAFCARLDALRVLRGHEVVNGWQAAARAGQTRDVVRDLLLSHYDPVYLQSMRRNFAGFAQPVQTVAWDGSAASLAAAAQVVASASSAG